MALTGAVPQAQFSLYDVVDKKPVPTAFAEFTALTGGEQKISLVTYNIISPEGSVTTKSMPGQTTFSPIQLLRPMDAYAVKIYEKMRDAIDGKLTDLRKNYSVSMNDARGKPIVFWHLINAVPSVLDGFLFNMHTENNLINFQITLQAEDIQVEFV